MLTIRRNHLLALTKTSSLKDIRYYLNGGLIESAANGDMYFVSTNGSCMFTGRVLADNVAWDDKPENICLIVPVDVLKKEGKGKGCVKLSKLDDVKWLLGDTVFTPIDGTFPDWRRLFRPLGAVAPVQTDPDQLMRIVDAFRVWTESPKLVPFQRHGGNRIDVVCKNIDACGLVMGYRHGFDYEDVQQFNPSEK